MDPTLPAGPPKAARKRKAPSSEGSAAPAGPPSPSARQILHPPAARRRKPLVSSLRVLSIDVGLRNLGLALVRLVNRAQERQLLEEDSVTPLGRKVGKGDELPVAEFADPTDVLDLLCTRIAIEHAENVDVLEENGCTAKNAKGIGPLRQVQFWHGCMMRRASLLLDPPPDLVVVEVQDGGNATMRQMSTGIVGLFMGHFEARHRDGKIARVPAFTMVRGDMKIKICERVQRGWAGGSIGAAGSSGGADLSSGAAALGSIGAAGGSSVGPSGSAPPPKSAESPPPAACAPPPAASLPPPAACAPPAAAPTAAAAVAPTSIPEPPAYLLKVNPRRYYAMKRAFDQEVAARAKMAELGLDQSVAVVRNEDEEEADETATKKQRRTAGRSKAAYELRKKLAVASFELYMDRVLSSAPHLLNRELRLGWRKYTQKKRRDVSDAVLQGVYVIARELKLV